jgi:hypothetical protein
MQAADIGQQRVRHVECATTLQPCCPIAARQQALLRTARERVGWPVVSSRGQTLIRAFVLGAIQPIPPPEACTHHGYTVRATAMATGEEMDLAGSQDPRIDEPTVLAGKDHDP